MAIPSRKRKPNRTVFHGYDPSIALVPGDPRLSPPPSWFGVSYHPSQPVSNSWLEWAGDRTAMFDISQNTIVSVSQYSQIATEKSKRQRQETKAQPTMPVPFPFFNIMWHPAQPMPNEWHDWGDSPPPSRKDSPDNNASPQHQQQQQQQQLLHSTSGNHHNSTHSHANTANIQADNNSQDDDLAAQSAKLQQLLQAAGTPPPPPGMMQAFHQMQEAINAAASAGGGGGGGGTGNVNRSISGLAPAPPASIAPVGISPALAAVPRAKAQPPKQQRKPPHTPSSAQQQTQQQQRQRRNKEEPTAIETVSTGPASSSLKALVPVAGVHKSDVSSSMKLLLKEQEDKRLAASARTRQQAQVNRARKQKYLNIIEDYLAHLGELSAAVAVDHATATHAHYFSLLDDDERGRGRATPSPPSQFRHTNGTGHSHNHHHHHQSQTATITKQPASRKGQIVREQMRALQIAVLSGNSTFNSASHVHCQHNGEAVAIATAVSEGNHSSAISGYHYSRAQQQQQQHTVPSSSSSSAVIISKDVSERAKEATELVVALETRRLRVALDKPAEARRCDTQNAFAAIDVALQNLAMAETALDLLNEQLVMGGPIGVNMLPNNNNINENGHVHVDLTNADMDVDVDDIPHQVNRMRGMSLYESNEDVATDNGYSSIAGVDTGHTYRGNRSVATTSELEELRADFNAQLGLSQDQQSRVTALLTRNIPQATHPTHTDASAHSAQQGIDSTMIRAACARKAMRGLSRLFEDGGQSQQQDQHKHGAKNGNGNVSLDVSTLADNNLVSCLKPKQIDKLLTKTAEFLVDGRLPGRTTREDGDGDGVELIVGTPMDT